MGVIAPQDQERIGQAIADRIVQTALLAAEKAAAYEKDPSAYPIPSDPNSFERIYLSMLRTVKPEIKQRAVTQLTASLEANKTIRRAKFGDLAEIDLRSATPISEQVRSLPPLDLKLPLVPPQASPSVDIDADKIVLKSHSLGNVVEPLELRLIKVHCIDETGGFVAELASDDMRLSGVATNPDGTTYKLPILDIGIPGGFDDGEWNTKPQTVNKFNLNGGTGFPKGCIITLVLAEEDFGKLSGFLNQLLAKVQEEITKQLKAAAAAAAQKIQVWIGIPAFLTTAAANAAIDYGVKKLVDAAKSWFEDDLFKPRTISFEVPSAVAEINSPTSIRWKEHGGEYELFFQWIKPRGQHRFNAIWTPSEQGQFLSWGRTIDQIQADYGDMWKDNYRLIDLQAYVASDNTVLYNGVWNPANHGQSVVWDWALKDFGTHYGKMWKDNFRLLCQQAFVVNGQALYNGVWNPADHAQFVSWDKPGETINKQYGEMWNQKMRLVDLQAYVVNNQVFYNGIWNPGEYGQLVAWSDDLSVFKTRYDDMLKQNFRLYCQQAFIVNGQVRYLGVWNATNEKRIATWDQSIDVLGKVYGEQWNKKFRLLDMDIF